MQQTDIAIVGGGMVGLTLACALGDSGLEVVVADPQTPPATEAPLGESAYDARVSALTAASEQILRNLGAWETMAALRVCPYREMEVWDGEGTGRLHFSAASVHQPQLGHIVENRVTLAGLHRAFQRHDNLSWRGGAALAALSVAENGRRVLTFDDGSQLAARLVVAADGARSRTRELAGLPVHAWDYQHHAIVATVRTEQPLHATAWQRFTEDGPLAFLPLAGGEGRNASIVWSTSPDHARELMALGDAAFCAELQDAFEHRLGSISKPSPRHCFPLTQRHAPSYLAEHLALAGDAAHSIHPLAGQGVNLGLLDAAVLAEEIRAAHELGIDFADPSRLRRYQRRRQGDNLRMMAMMAALRHLYGRVPPPLQWLRNRGMGAVNRLAPLKHYLAMQAMGQRRELPALARPEAEVAASG
ncbi:UbiH/UbiF/VisC/COQ6 family ubiquinone biosynthesis hydroxylase [Motiliproteus sp. SC1-56]|uniref:UbiH/UbiF/VisC/COQ6 family ubiquinone biosynthesis hydroxylase n=1 Tax=Motiliproteus sp. SC1-56 TaxID=2799565 RepID=UPI001A8DF650|nr:UbiH/UbiF/VisC/COQ6 family ubiquinone biosynthesis hydroxylase [Motiliproteus sp. SC1-56]